MQIYADALIYRAKRLVVVVVSSVQVVKPHSRLSRFVLVAGLDAVLKLCARLKVGVALSRHGLNSADLK